MIGQDMTQTGSSSSRGHDFFSSDTSQKMSFFELDSAADITIVGAAGMSSIPDEVRVTVDVDAYFDGRMSVQPCVAHPDLDGMSLGSYWFEPNFTMPSHYHDTDQIVYVVEGEMRQGGRILRPGSGYFTRAGTPYGFTVGPAGCRILEFRDVTQFATVFVESSPARWAHRR